MSYEVRVPEALILAPIQPWIKMVWIAARSFQGAGDCCFASLTSIGERALLGSGGAMDKGQVSHGLKALEKMGFIERIGPRKVRCIAPDMPEREAGNVEPHSTNVEPHSTFDTEEDAPNVEPHSTNVEPHSTTVEPHSTPSKNQQLKPTRKTKKVTDRIFADDEWQARFALAAFDRLVTLGILPGTLERKRDQTIAAFADQFDKLHRLDGYDEDTIAGVMRWLLSPSNWWIQTANFRSVLKLRKPHKDGGSYFEHFLAQVRNHGNAKNGNHTSYSETDAAGIYEAALAGAVAAGS